MLQLRRFYFTYLFIELFGGRAIRRFRLTRAPAAGCVWKHQSKGHHNTVSCESTFFPLPLQEKKNVMQFCTRVGFFLWPCTKKNEMTACPLTFRVVDWWALLSCCAARFTPLLMSQQAFTARQILVWNDEHTLTHSHSKYTLHLFAALICPGIHGALSLPLLPWLWCLRY